MEPRDLKEISDIKNVKGARKVIEGNTIGKLYKKKKILKKCKKRKRIA